MANDTPVKQHSKSKLDQFTLGFEYNRSLSVERKMTRQRIDHTQ